MSNKAAVHRVLFVCTGNICRSPLAEQLFRDLANKGGLVLEFDSAGVFAEVGNDIHPQSQRAMKMSNIEPSTHRAKQLTKELTSQADLILTATVDHSNSTAQLDPASSRKIFTIKEFARIADYLTQNSELTELKSVSDKLKAAMQFRGYAPRSTVSEDILDPWGHNFEAFLAVTEETQDLAQKIIDWLGAK